MLVIIVACVLAVAQSEPQPHSTGAPLLLSDAAPQAVPAGPAAGQTAAVSPAEQAAARILGVDDPLRITIDAGVWIASLTGTAQVGAGGTSFELNHDLAVGGLTPGIAGEFAVWTGRWRFGGVGCAIDVDSTESAPKSGTFGGTVIAAGDSIRGRMTLWMAGAEAGYTVWRPFSDEPWPWSVPGANRAQATQDIGKNGRPLYDVRLLALAGGLVMGYDQTVYDLTTGSRSSFDKTVGAIYGGGGVEMDLGMDGRIPVIQDVRLYAYFGIGPSIPDADIVWMVRVGVVAMLNANIGVEFGYRLFDFDLQDGPSEVDGGVRGIFAALAVKF